MEQDQAIIRAYSTLRVSADRIAVFTDDRRAFLRLLPSELREGREDELIWRLMQLRKQRKLPNNSNEN